MDHSDAVFFEDDKTFEAWLVDNASNASHVWIRMAKKGTGVTSIDWTTAVDVALCFGWIDGIARRLDDEWYVQRFTRGAPGASGRRSTASALSASPPRGGCAPPAWQRWKGRRRTAAGTPPTTARPMQWCPTTSPPPWPRAPSPTSTPRWTANRFAFLNRIQTAVRPETRARRIEQLTDALAQGKTPYPAPTKKSGT